MFQSFYCLRITLHRNLKTQERFYCCEHFKSVPCCVCVCVCASGTLVKHTSYCPTQETPNTEHQTPYIRGGSRIWLRGGPNCGWPKCADVAQQSHEQSELIKAWGLGPTLGPQKLLGFSWLNMHSPSFPGTFWLNFFCFYLYKMLIKTF